MGRIIAKALLSLFLGFSNSLLIYGQGYCPQLVCHVLRTDSLVMECETSSYTVFVPHKGIGYAIVSKSDSHKIIGFSRESEWKENAFPEILKEWLSSFTNETKEQLQASSKYFTAELETNEAGQNTIEPLLTTHWHQNSPYNNYAPVIEDGNIKTAAGCVAIAAAQVTYYWWKDNPFATLKDTPVYPYGGAPVTYSIPKGTPNDWKYIKSEYSSSDSDKSKDAVARLCYVIGTTSYLDYATSTGGQIRDAANAIYSQYNLASEFLSRSKCNSQEEWEQLLYCELSNGRPVLCSGSGDGGHAFVLDGYDATTGLFHFNFGWGGSGDGYYPVDDSQSSMGGFYMNQAIIYNIHPNQRNINAIISTTRASQDSVNINIKITNYGTLPASVRLICSNSDNIIAQNSDELWQSVINKDSITVTENVVISNEIISENPILILLDEYDSHICDYTFVPSGIDTVAMSKEISNKKIYGIDGIVLKKIGHAGFYIIREGNTNKKILIKFRVSM